MKIIFLNCWYAKAGKAFFDFFEEQKASTDIFALSEIQPNLNKRLKKILDNFQSDYISNLKIELLGYKYGQSVFFRKNTDKPISKRIDLFRQVKNDMGFMQFLKFRNGLVVGNIHGKARPGHKLDTPARINQTKKIIDYFKNKKGPKIIGGDFNLMPDTKSVNLFENSSYKNLIKDFEIKNTRNKHAWDQHTKKDKQYFADFCFVSNDIKVKSFKVPNILISDHLPLILEFEI